ncbi:RPA family protein [Halobaculum marinum]|uniref:RPA family protein n=1 Tax=Halobaculum marinum TaxID=3031996 RepID=A0ABD5WZ32_9EURY|nr:hypothetical protein [Halobaculum sp. DT55]
MSSNDSGGGDSGPGTREVAHRIFAAEFDDADFDYSESDEERAPNYVVTPTGLRVNRLFTVGVLTEVESVNEQTLRGRVVDPSGAFVTYAGQYQPDEMAFLDRTTPPAFVALTGKARTFQPEDSDLVYTSVRPESFATVDAATRDRWVVSAAEATLQRIAVFEAALATEDRGDRLRARLEAAGVPTALAAGIPLAIDHYDTGTRYLEAVRTLAVDALEVVADEREEVRDLTADPGERGGAELGPLPDVPYDVAGAVVPDDVAGAEVDADVEVDAEATEETAAGATEAEAADSDATAVAAGTDASGSTASTVDDTATDEADTAAEPAEAADAEPDSVDTAEVGTAESDTADAADTDTTEADADDDLAEVDEPEASTASADTEAAVSTDPTTDFDDDTTDTADTVDDDTASEPAEATGAEPDSADVAEADPGAGAEPEPVESADATADDGLGDFDDDLGEFDAGEEPVVDLDADPEDLDDALTEEERREVEEEHGVEFSTGSEVPEPGESGIETPEPTTAPDEDDDGDAESAAATAETDPASDADGDADPAAESDTAAAAADEESAAEADADDDDDGAAEAPDDLEAAVVDLMSELDDGDGADKEAVVAAAVDRYGVDAADAEDAIDDALMSGQCFEPTDGTLKAI